MELLSVTKKLGEQTVLKDFSLSLPEKGTFCLFGPSGCGKTTLLRLIAGLEKPDGGQIIGLTGKRVSYVFQEHRLFPWMTARENVAAVLPSQKQAAGEWLERVGLKEGWEKRPDQLSGGMKRRVSLARALAYGGDVLLLDEPFQGLDQHAVEALCQSILRYNSAALTLLVTHQPLEARLLADEILPLQGPPLQTGSWVKASAWRA